MTLLTVKLGAATLAGIVLLPAVVSTAFAQSNSAASLTGRVVGETGKPVAGVLVFAQSGFNKAAAKTDALGQFSFSGLPPMPTTILVRDSKGLCENSTSIDLQRTRRSLTLKQPVCGSSVASSTCSPANAAQRIPSKNGFEAFLTKSNTISLCRGGELVSTLADAPSKITALDISADSRYVVSAGADGMVKVWEVASAKPVRSFPGLQDVSSVGFSDDARYAGAVDSKGVATIWDLQISRIPVKTRLSGVPDQFTVSPDGKSVVAAKRGDDKPGYISAQR